MQAFLPHRTARYVAVASVDGYADCYAQDTAPRVCNLIQY